MANQYSQNTPVLPLPPFKKNLIQIGCICIMLAIAMYGLALSTLISPILSSINAMDYVSLFSITSVLGITIMTPIGGKLGDLVGRKNIVVISGIICILACIGIAFVRSLIPLLLLLLALGLSQGAFTAAPYIIVGLINEQKVVPKIMGILATAVAVGGFLGSMIAGVLTDLGFLEFAILVPALPLTLGILLIGINLPNKKREGKVSIDVPGILALTLSLCGILLSLNFAPTLGWLHPVILLGFGIGIAAFILLIKIESKVSEPLIPLKLFKNFDYTLFLIMGFICYFYQTAMNVYAPVAALNVIGVSTSTAGTLQMPRTIITIFLPAVVGTWVGKQISNMWKAIFGGALLAGIPMLIMGFTTNNTSILLYYFALALTGIAESYRAVSITPAAQVTLSTEDMGIGTSLVGFSNALSNTLAAAIFGVIYNLNIASDPTSILNIQNGVNAVFLSAAAVSFIGVIVTLVFIRPRLSKKKDIAPD